MRESPTALCGAGAARFTACGPSANWPFVLLVKVQEPGRASSAARGRRGLAGDKNHNHQLINPCVAVALENPIHLVYSGRPDSLERSRVRRCVTCIPP